MISTAMARAYLASKTRAELRALLESAEKVLSDDQFLAVVDVAKQGLARRWPQSTRAA